MADLGLVLNPTSDGYPVQLDIAEGTAYVCVGADFPPPPPKPAYASSYDTEGSVATDPAHYENREITVQLVVYGTSAANLETRLNALYKMVGQLNREGGSLKLTTVAGTVCYFDLVPENAAVTQFNPLYMVSNAAEVALAFQGRPFWRGTEVSVGTFSETTLPALVATFSPGSGTYSAAVLADTPQLYWRLGDAVGAGTVADASGNARTGTPGSGVTLGTAGLLSGDSDTAASFDGTANASISSTYAAFAGARTFEGWATLADATIRAIFTGGTNPPYLTASTTGFNFSPNFPTVAMQSWAIALSGTFYWALTYDNATRVAELFVNGVSLGTKTYGTGYGATPGNIALNSNSGDPRWSGKQDEFAIYGSVLSAARVLAHYQTGAVRLAGDVPGLGRLVITDTESGGKDRWTVIVGGQSRYYSSATTAKLFYEAEALTPTGTSTLAAGATGASGAGSNVVRNTDLTTTYQAIVKSTVASGTASLTHDGTFRLWAKVYRPTSNTGAVSVKLEWAEGDYVRVTQNDPVAYAADDREGVFTWANLGIVSIDPASTRWEFRLLARSTVAGDELDVDCFTLFPTEVVYTELSGRLRLENPSAFSARDEFDQTAGALTGKTAPVGGVWAGAGSANDFSVEIAGKTAQRVAVSDADVNTGRYAVSGVAAFAAQASQVDFKASALVNVAADLYMGAVARYTDTNNWLMATVDGTAVPKLRVRKRVAGTVTTLATVAVPVVAAATFYSVRLLVDAAGRWFVWFWQTAAQPGDPIARGQDAALATAAALATGKPGFYDAYTDSGARTRNFDNFFAFAPVSDAAIFGTRSLTLGATSATRQDSTGVFSTKVSYPNGRYLKIPPAGPEGRSTRLAVLALPNDPYTMGDAAAIYDLSAQLYVTPRGLVVPEA